MQAPVVLVALLALRGVARRAGRRSPPGGRTSARTLALLLVSGALVAALFLLVILLINGWRLEPLAAGLVVTVMPLAAIAAARLGRGISPLWARAASGAILIAGGLGRARLASARGRGLDGRAAARRRRRARARALGADRARARRRARRRPCTAAGRSRRGTRASCSGCSLLTPIFTADLERNEEDALAAGTAVVLDSEIPPLEKIGVARDILVAVDEAKEEVRIPAVDEVIDEGDDPAYAELVAELQDQLDRAVTNAFSRSFLVAALLGLLALVPILLARREVSV